MKQMIKATAIAILFSVSMISFAGALDNSSVNIIYKKVAINGVPYCVQFSVKNNMENVVIVNPALCSQSAPVIHHNTNATNNGQSFDELMSALIKSGQYRQNSDGSYQYIGGVQNNQQ